MLQRVFTRVSKPAARYSDRGSMAEHCSACRFFMSGGDCARVLGRVLPQGWCKYFSSEAVQRWNPLWPMEGIPAPPGATLDLSFMNPGVLDPRVSFTRASTATYFNSAGVMQTAATNLWLYSADASNAAWIAAGSVVAAPIVTANQTAAPDGTATAARVVIPAVAGASAFSLLYQQIALAAGTYTFSAYMKGSVGGERVYLAVGGWGSLPAVLTTQWQRFVFVTPTFVAATFAFEIGVDLRDGAQTSTPAQTIFVWGAQVELGSTASPYIPTTSAPNGAPRWDYNPATLALQGLLIEEARTNLVLASADASNVAWNVLGLGGPVAPVVTGNQTTAPDGTVTAARVVYPAVSGASALSLLYQQVTVTAVPYTFSVWLKGAVGGEQLYLGANSASYVNGGRVTLTTSWQRFSVTATLTAAGWFFDVGTDLRDGVQTSTPAQTIYVWGAQVEQGGFPTSLIPTTAAAVTRAADYATMPLAGWYSATAGTIEAEAMLPANGNNGYRGIFQFDPGVANNVYMNCYTQNGNANMFYNIDLTSPFIATITPGTAFKLAATYAATGSTSAYNGTMTGATAVVSAPATYTTLRIGRSDINVNAANGYMRRVRYWPRVLSNAEMQQVTT